MKESALVTVPSLAEKYGVDVSNLRKKIKALGIKTQKVIRGSTKKSCTAITKKDKARLEKQHPELADLPDALPSDVSISAIAREFERDIKSIIQRCRVREIPMPRKRVGGRGLLVVSKKDYTKLKKENVVVVD